VRRGSRDRTDDLGSIVALDQGVTRTAAFAPAGKDDDGHSPFEVNFSDHSTLPANSFFSAAVSFISRTAKKGSVNKS